mgnify:CR=1 FL=1
MMKIGVVGLGLIGGSMALDLRQQGYSVMGVSRRAETCEQAIARNIVDQADIDLRILTDADIVVLCTPLKVLEATTEQLIPHLKPQTILTDVGSVKGSIVERLTQRWANFVGGHPMAGTAEQGLDAAQSNLFVDRPYVLTPIEQTSPAALEQVAALARSLGAVVHQCDPHIHDRAVAWISHLPVMVSSSLIAACLQESDPTVRVFAQIFASSGFRDTSRVGGGNSELGLMMAQHNRTALLHALTHYRQQLDQVIAMIDQEDWRSLKTALEKTHAARPNFVS